MTTIHAVIVAAVIAAMSAQSIAGPRSCGFKAAFLRADEKGKTQVQVYEGAADPLIAGARPLLFVSSLKVNTDGTRISYNANDPHGRTLAINTILNAMRDKHRSYANFEAIRAADWPQASTWTYLNSQVIERDARTGKPCLDAQGYMNSKTSVAAVDDPRLRDGDCNHAKWLDALDVNALVLPKGKTQFEARSATNRTPVVAMTLAASARLALGLVGDKGDVDQLGEASVAMNRTLNGLPSTDRPTNYRDAMRRFQAPRSAILLFPGTANLVPRPLTGTAVDAATGRLFERWGGRSRLESCLTEIPDVR